MSEWQTKTLGEITDWFSGGTPSKQNESYWNGDIPWISAKTLKATRVSDSELKITEEGLDNGSRLAQVGDLLLLVRGSGLFNSIPISIVEKPVSFNQDIKAIRIKEEYNHISPWFLLYWLHGNKRILNGIMEETGIGAGKFDLGLLKDLTIELPPKNELKEITETFKSIDDKIVLLTQQNQNLEKLAQILFKRWFVEFEFPTENGEPYKSSGGKMVESELGEIPEGWKVGKLEDITSRITDGSHHSPSSVENGMPMASVKDMNDWDFNIDSCRKISQVDYDELVRNDCKPLKDDILIAKDGSYLKHVFVAPKDLDVVLLSSIAMIRPNGDYRPILLSIFLKQKSTVREMKNIVSGAVIERIVLKDFRKFSLVIPSIDIQTMASKQIEPLIKMLV